MAEQLEARVTRLEEEDYFLRRRLEELDSALKFQQGQIDVLESSLRRFKALLEQMRDAQAQAGGTLPANDPPPHYNTW